MATEQDSGMGLAWFLVGVAVGAAVALLYAPKSGKETREYLRKKADEGREMLSDTSREVYEKGKDIYERGREVADEAAELFERGRKLARG
ncbi:MAG: YtxH domain-containing protein [Bryobacteraceae bacterium]